jgi:hypothetical protein
MEILRWREDGEPVEAAATVEAEPPAQAAARRQKQ